MGRHVPGGSGSPCGPDVHTRYIVVAGNVGSGKTTLATVLAGRLRLRLHLESVDDNPYLERFYEDMPRWGFELNMYFLAARSEQIADAVSMQTASIFDRSLYEDVLFVDLAFADGTASAEHYETFRRLYDVLEKALPAPALLIYLSAPVEVLASRISVRGRLYERAISMEYLQRLQTSYDGWVNTYTRSPILRLDSAATDFRVDDAAVSAIEGAITTALGTGYRSINLEKRRWSRLTAWTRWMQR